MGDAVCAERGAGGGLGGAGGGKGVAGEEEGGGSLLAPRTLSSLSSTTKKKRKWWERTSADDDDDGGGRGLVVGVGVGVVPPERRPLRRPLFLLLPGRVGRRGRGGGLETAAMRTPAVARTKAKLWGGGRYDGREVATDVVSVVDDEEEAETVGEDVHGRRLRR